VGEARAGEAEPQWLLQHPTPHILYSALNMGMELGLSSYTHPSPTHCPLPGYGHVKLPGCLSPNKLLPAPS
jgi:hypothetical protein